MKKLFTLFFALSFVFAFTVKGQNATVSIPDVVESSGTVYIPVNVDFSLGTAVGSLALTIHFNEDYLEFVGIDNAALGDLTATNPSDGVILLSWADLGGPGSTLEGKLTDLEFIYTGGEDNLWFASEAPGVTELSDPIGNVIADVQYTNGSIALAAPVPISNWAIYAGLLLILGFVAFRVYKIA